MQELRWAATLRTISGESRGVRAVTPFAGLRCMASTFKELVCWQQAHALRSEVWQIVQRAPDMDVKLRSQMTDAAGSICRNIAEGFRKRSHKEFARYLEHATCSLSELEDGLIDAQMRGHISDQDMQAITTRVKRTSAPLARLLRYLRNNPDGN
jgi:four helix bundle protein